MNNLRSVVIQTNNIKEIRGLIGVYEEIAAGKLQKARSAILSAQDYFIGLSTLSDEVALDLSTYYQNKNKFAAVFLSADTGLYGELIDKILVSFVNFVKQAKVEAFVLGNLGVSLMNSYAPEIKFTTINLDGETEDIGEDGLVRIMNFLSPYSKIYIFHGRFESIARQEAASSVISGPELSKYGGGNIKETQEKRFANIYEPDAETIGAKFGKEISASIFDQSNRENQLAKYAARLMHLDSALDNIDIELDKLDSQKRRMRKKIEQKKQTERTARWRQRI